MAPWLATGADGRASLSWIEPLEGGGHVLRLCAATGGGWGPAREVARGDDWFVNWADTPRHARFTDGTLVATWLQRLGSDTYAYGVRYALSSDEGRAWSEPAWLHDDRSPTEHGFPSLVAEGDRLRALWLDGRAAAAGDGHAHAGAMQLRTRTLDPGGALGPEALLDERVCDCCPTAMARLAGRTWLAFRDRSEDEVRDVVLASLDPPADLAAVPDLADGWWIDGCPVNGPALAVSGEALGLAWFTAEGERARVRAVRSDDGGASFSAAVELPCEEPFGSVSAAFDPQGRLVVTWLESGSDGLEDVWRMARVGVDGGTSVAWDLAAAPPGRAGGIGRLVPADGGLLFAWTGGGDAGGVRSMRIEFAR